MKLSHLAIAIALAGTCRAGNLPAEEFDYYGANAGTTQTVSSSSSCGCDTSCDCGCPDVDCGDPWTLQEWLNPCGNCRGITWGGWVQVGFTANDENFRDLEGNSPIGFNHSSTDVMVNQLWVFAGKEADTGGCGTDWGFRVDYMFGYDHNDTRAFNGNDFDTKMTSSQDAAGFPLYGSALPQAYFEVAYNDVTIKLGHFFTLIGYEVVPAPDNFFYSHAYTMIYGEPFTHTGVLASYAVSDRVNVHGGWTTGWDAGDNSNSANTFLGGFDWTSCDGRTTFAYMVTAGDWGNGVAVELGGADGTATSGDIYMHSLVLTRKIGCNTTYIIQSDYGANKVKDPNQTGGPTRFVTDEWYGVNQYLIYDINCCWSAGLRAEWFRDADGARLGNSSDDYYAVTAGLNWKPRANVNVRPEIRYDWVEGGSTPYAGGVEDNLGTAAVDVVFTF